MAVEPLPNQSPSVPATRSEARFPGYDLATATEVPRAIHTGGGALPAENLAAQLGYKGTNNGAYLTKIGAARTFGLVSKNGSMFVATPLAHRILSPVYPHEAQIALIEAFFNVELFKRIYEDWKGRELPSEFGMKNALRLQYGIVPARVDLAYRTLLDSAETAGFFAAKLGARTHLIQPVIQPPQASYSAAPEPSRQTGGGGGGGDDSGGGEGGMPPSSPVFKPAAGNVALSDVKAKYVATLIKLFEAKSEKGELDEKLMERIERLLEGN